MAAKWTEAQIEAAITAVCIGGKEAGIAFVTRHPALGFAISVDFQCELTEARELLSQIDQLTPTTETEEYFTRNK